MAEEGGETQPEASAVLRATVRHPRLHPTPPLSRAGTAGNSQTHHPLLKTKAFCERSSSPHRCLTAQSRAATAALSSSPNTSPTHREPVQRTEIKITNQRVCERAKAENYCFWKHSSNDSSNSSTCNHCQRALCKPGCRFTAHLHGKIIKTSLSRKAEISH